jgi:hydrogenase maturation protease
MDRIVEAVLYSGHILHPYRRSASNNRHLFKFGRVYPETYSSAEEGPEPCVMQTQCLLRSCAGEDSLDVSVRFLQPMSRAIGALAAPLDAWPMNDEPAHEIVPELDVDGVLYQSWQEAVERSVSVPDLPIRRIARNALFAFPLFRGLEPVRDRRDRIVALMIRRREALDGVVEVAVEPLPDHVFRVTVRILNCTSVPRSTSLDEEQVLKRTFASTHVILKTRGGEFLSLTNPPFPFEEEAAACRNIGTWPVLFGLEFDGPCDTMLSSPIILSDYPRFDWEGTDRAIAETDIEQRPKGQSHVVLL